MTEHAAVLGRMPFGKRQGPVSVTGYAHLLGCLFTLYAENLQRFTVIIIKGYAQRCLLGGEQPQTQHNRRNHYDKQYVCLANFHACIPVFN
jgi:hypothetical protein